MVLSITRWQNRFSKQTEARLRGLAKYFVECQATKICGKYARMPTNIFQKLPPHLLNPGEAKANKTSRKGGKKSLASFPIQAPSLLGMHSLRSKYEEQRRNVVGEMSGNGEMSSQVKDMKSVYSLIL
mmetsp:Transcript_34507/g.47815  ORF Transcript_34507/g.47815 Transcript_34507/m.47815 type:complete len:127 (-) Transcript_34507:87-467(-)